MDTIQAPATGLPTDADVGVVDTAAAKRPFNGQVARVALLVLVVQHRQGGARGLSQTAGIDDIHEITQETKLDDSSAGGRTRNWAAYAALEIMHDELLRATIVS